MNRLERPRRRPRVRSTSWQRLRWLVEREAALHVVYPRLTGWVQDQAARREARGWKAPQARGIVERLLKVFPERRWYYGPG